jgi:hypothetical protein
MLERFFYYLLPTTYYLLPTTYYLRADHPNCPNLTWYGYIGCGLNIGTFRSRFRPIFDNLARIESELKSKFK